MQKNIVDKFLQRNSKQIKSGYDRNRNHSKYKPTKKIGKKQAPDIYQAIPKTLCKYGQPVSNEFVTMDFTQKTSFCQPTQRPRVSGAFGEKLKFTSSQHPAHSLRSLQDSVAQQSCQSLVLHLLFALLHRSSSFQPRVPLSPS